MARPLHIACLQTQPRATMGEAIDEALPMAEAAAGAGAKVVFLPEYCGGLKSDGQAFDPPAAAEGSHEFLAAMREFAARAKVWVMVGSVAVDGPGGKRINRGFMLDDTGAITGRYDKVHLFDVDLDGASYRESDTIAPGGSAVAHETPYGKIGHTICYDLRFPQLYRDLAHAGAEILTCPAAFTKVTGEAHWHVLNRARAIENTAFMVSACAIGPVPGGGACYGHSLVVGPWGEVLADGKALPGVVHAEIDLEQAAQAAGRIPSLRHDQEFASAGVRGRPAA